MYHIRHYLTLDGINVFGRWFNDLKDRMLKIALDRRLARAELGNFGDHKFCRDGVWELRVDMGAGYRIYYTIENNLVVLLLNGGDKGSQSKDIDQAVLNLRDWKSRPQP